MIFGLKKYSERAFRLNQSSPLQFPEIILIVVQVHKILGKSSLSLVARTGLASYSLFQKTSPFYLELAVCPSMLRAW